MPDLKLRKVKGHQLERLYRKAGLLIHKDIYNNHITHYKDSISQTKPNYYSEIICSSDSLFSLFKKITQASDSLPPHLFFTDFCNSFMSFFTEKIQKIHQHLSSQPTPSIPSELLSSFQLHTTSEISDLIHNSKPSTCQLDPLPSVLVKAGLPSLVPLISAISLSTGSLPTSLKQLQ